MRRSNKYSESLKYILRGYVNLCVYLMLVKYDKRSSQLCVVNYRFIDRRLGGGW